MGEVKTIGSHLKIIKTLPDTDAKETIAAAKKEEAAIDRASATVQGAYSSSSTRGKKVVMGSVLKGREEAKEVTNKLQDEKKMVHDRAGAAVATSAEAQQKADEDRANANAIAENAKAVAAHAELPSRQFMPGPALKGNAPMLNKIGDDG